MANTRIPTQKRSLEKYEKVIEAAMKLFNEKGYFNTTTTDIAKESGIAVGSIYSYFSDKKEIYIEISNRIQQRFNEPVIEYWKKNAALSGLKEEEIKSVFRIFIDFMMQEHDFSELFHNDMNALRLLDEDIAKLGKENDLKRDQKSRKALDEIHIPFHDDLSSDVFLHYCNLLIDDVCHTIKYNHGLNKKEKEIYIEQAVDMMYDMLKRLSSFS